MNDKLNESQLSQDEIDQQELDAAYNEMHGITEDKDQSEPNVSDETKEDVVDDLPNGENADANDPLADILNDEQQKPTDEEDTLDQDSKKEDEHSDDYVDLDGSPEDDEDTLIKPDDPVGVQKRIGKEVQRRKALEAEIAGMKAQQDQLMRMMMGQGQPQGQFGTQPQFSGVAPQALPQFVPPAPSKPYEEMNEFERFNYFQQVTQAEAQAKQVYAEQQSQQQKFAADVEKTKAAIARAVKDKGDEVLRNLLTVDRGHYTPYMMAAIADYPNAASLTRYLHTKHNAELAILKDKSPEAQMRGIVRMAERVNLERQQTFQKKAQAKKPAPAGKLKSATLPNTNGKKDIYSAEFLERLTPEQWDKLVAKGY